MANVPAIVQRQTAGGKSGKETSIDSRLSIQASDNQFLVHGFLSGKKDRKLTPS